MGKTNEIYTPLKLVKEYAEARRILEIEVPSLQSDEGTEDLVRIASEYAVDQVLEMNKVPFGVKLSDKDRDIFAGQAYDYAVATVVTAYWRKCKQVYTFSREFFDMILDMDDFEIGWAIYDYLPFDTFYLEIKDHEVVDGVMVKYTKSPNQSILYTICGKPGQPLNINSGIVDPRETTSYKSFFDTEVFCSKANANSPYVIFIRQLLAFTLQACMYLCAKNADIEENQTQKGIYRPHTFTVRDKFSEIRKWDVGVRVMREHKAVTSGKKPAENSGERRRPRQHWRKAHWHTYWVGQGRTKREVKFIAPVLVNDTSDDDPVVMHQ